MKIIFAGTPHFAACALQALLDRHADIVAVLTQPDRPSGRGMQLKSSPVKQLAEQHGLTVLQPTSLKDAAIQLQLADCRADVMVVAAYGLILPEAVLKIPRLGCLNIHASLLPRWRGAAPIQRAILAGDAQTGITIMQMDVGLDTGDMLLKKSCEITANDNAETLHDKLAVLGAAALTEVLARLDQGGMSGVKQDDMLANYAAKLSKEEARLDWSLDAIQLERAVRGYNPFPGASVQIGDTPIRIWRASMRTDMAGEPGMILALEKEALVVACGTGALALEVLQRPNAKALPAAQFLQGFHLQAGDRFVRH